MKLFQSSPIMVLLRLWIIFSIFLAQGSAPAAQAAVLDAPAAPKLVTPAVGDVIYATPEEPKAIPIFTWEPVEGAAYYDLQVSTTIGFNDGTRLIEVLKLPHNSYIPNEANLPNDMDLYWRVRAGDAKNVYGNYSEGQIFRRSWLEKHVNGVITANKPVLLLPANNAELAFNDPLADRSQPPSFSWEPVLGATFYSLEFSLNPSFSPLYGSPYTTSSTTYQLPLKLADNTYYWRVVPKMDGKVPASGNIWTGHESETRTVRFNYNETFLPELSEPENNATVTFSPTFRWSSVRGAKNYILQYSTSSGFPGTSETVTITTFAPSYTPPSPLKNDQNYYWRVRAVSGNSSSPIWSETRQFFKKWYLKARLLTPINGYRFTSEPYLSWTPVEGASYYRLEFSPNNSFAGPRVKTTSNTFYADRSNNCPIEGIPGTVVFWRVIAVDNAGNFSEPSNHSSFDCASPGLAEEQAPVQVYPRYYEPVNAAMSISPHEDASAALPLFLWKRLIKLDGSRAQHAAYRVQVAADEYFELTNSIVWSLDTENMSALPASQAELAPGTYFWRVRALTGLGGEELGQWSQGWKMRFDPALLPPLQAGVTSTQLLRPAHGSEWTEMVPPFEWQPLHNAAGYRVQISSAGDPDLFMDPVYLKVDAQVEYPGYTHPERLPYGTYYWRVTGLDGSGYPMGEPSPLYRFQVTAQSRYQDNRVLGSNTAPIIANDPPDDINDPNLDVSDLAVTQDQYGWFFNFQANTGLEDKRFLLYIDIDHKDGSGAHVDPEGYNVTTVSGHRPEYVIAIYQNSGQFSPATTWIYKWNAQISAWEPRKLLAVLGGSGLIYEGGRLELRIRGTDIGMGEETSTMAVALFTGRVAGGAAVGPAQDTVPQDPYVTFNIPAPDYEAVVLSAFTSVSDRLAPIFPGNMQAHDPGSVWAVPALAWHAPVEVNVCRYAMRYGKDPLLTNWQEEINSITPSGFAFDRDLLGDNTYFWEMRPYYFIGNSCSYGGAWSGANAFVRKSPGPEGLTSTVDGNMIRLDWTYPEGGHSYMLQIDDDPKFTSINYEKTIGVNHHTPLDEPFENGITYYWRVKSLQYYNIEDAWSGVESFVIKRPVPSGAFTIPGTDPMHAMTSNPTMCWKAEETAYLYYVEVAYDDMFNTGYARFITEQNCYTYSSGMRDGSFFWRVAMVDGQNIISQFSLTQSYTKQYEAPEPLYPQAIADGTPVFTWSPVTGANRYRLQILDPATNALLKQYETVATSYRPLEKLDLKEYKWRVAMIDNAKSPGPYAGPYSDEVLIHSSIYETFLPALNK